MSGVCKECDDTAVVKSRSIGGTDCCPVCQVNTEIEYQNLLLTRKRMDKRQLKLKLVSRDGEGVA